MFSRIVSVDATNLSGKAMKEIGRLSMSPAKFYDTDPQGTDETVRRIGDADCVLASWRTVLDRDVFDKCRSIRYIGLCATSPANVDLSETRKRGIVVSNVHDYSDEATAEYVFAQLLCLARGLGGRMWKEEPCELCGKTIGIIGLGAVGKHVARLGLGFGMKVIYHSRTRNIELEKKGLEYYGLHDLIRASDVITLHVPRDTMILSAREFALIPKGTILVDTCLGKVFEPQDFLAWIRKGKNVAVFDLAVSEEYCAFRSMKNVVFPEILAAKTAEARERLGRKVIENARAFLSGRPTFRV